MVWKQSDEWKEGEIYDSTDDKCGEFSFIVRTINSADGCISPANTSQFDGDMALLSTMSNYDGFWYHIFVVVSTVSGNVDPVIDQSCAFHLHDWCTIVEFFSIFVTQPISVNTIHWQQNECGSYSLGICFAGLFYVQSCGMVVSNRSKFISSLYREERDIYYQQVTDADWRQIQRGIYIFFYLHFVHVDVFNSYFGH